MPREREDHAFVHPAVLAATFAITCGAWSRAALLWSSGSRAPAVSAFALGLSLGPCLTGYLTAPRGLRQTPLCLLLLTGGLGVLLPSSLAAFDRGLAGSLLLLSAGFAGAAAALGWAARPGRPETAATGHARGAMRPGPGGSPTSGTPPSSASGSR